MTRILSLLITLLLGATSQVGAQLLWRIETPDGQNISYLLGTHHLAPVEVLDSLSGYKEAFANAEVIVGELDMNSLQNPDVISSLASMAVAPADSTLTSLLTPAQRDSVESVMKEYLGESATLDLFAWMKPVQVSILLATAQTMKAFPDFDVSRQLDTFIQKQALTAGKEVKGLETVSQQASLIYGSPISEQVSELLDAVANHNESLQMARRLAALYLDGDLDGMLALMEEPGAGFNTRQQDRLIAARNAEWVKMLATFLPTASLLIVVGAGHLPGVNGLISLLRKEGFTVNPA
ncbi:MAG: TraB/GumN family protein [Duncaniella sp.]|nr:TraB/GumN family protein [Duncaniella sp.]